MAQMDFPFLCDDAKLKEFLVSWVAIEDEEDRLREEKRLLKEEYQDHFPMRGVLTMVKVLRVQRKLELHPKEPMSLVHQKMLQFTIEVILPGMQDETDVPPAATVKSLHIAGKRLGFALVAEQEA